jgi:hypothetical protein
VADARAGIVDRAATTLGIHEHADAAEDGVILMAQNAVTVSLFREPAFRGLLVESEVARKTLQVTFLDDDLVVAAAVRGTFQAVVLRFGGQGDRFRHVESSYCIWDGSRRWMLHIIAENERPSIH